MDFDLHEELLFENDKAKFYNDDNCRRLTQYIRKDDECNGNKGLKDWVILLVKDKATQSQEYLIFNNNGQVVDICSSFEATAVKIDLLKFAKMK